MPPYADDLYSTEDVPDDEDAQSFSDELSPVDGYFTRREDMPSNVYVPDPSADRKDIEDKVLIPGQTPGGARRTEPGPLLRGGESSAREVPSTNTAYPGPPQSLPSIPYASPTSTAVNTPPSSPALSRASISRASTSRASTSRTTTSYTRGPSTTTATRRPDSVYTERTSLMSAPPPAYSPSPTSPILPQRSNRTYNTFPQHQADPGYPSHHDRQRIQRAAEEYNETDAVSERTYDSAEPAKRRVSPRRELIRKILLAALLFAVLLCLVTTSFNFSTGDLHHSPSTGGPYCSAATIVKDQDLISYDFGEGLDLTILQETHEGEDTSLASLINTAGVINLRRLPKDSKYGAHFVMNVKVSDHDLMVAKTWDDHSRIFKVSTPRHANLGKKSGNHCISIEITAFIPENAKIGRIDVGSVTLALKVFDDLKVDISKDALFESVSGSVSFPDFDRTKKSGLANEIPDSFLTPNFTITSRNIIIATVSGSIHGLFPLYDSLELLSKSGTILAGVVPQSEDRSRLSARLQASTESGTITVELPLLDSAGVPLKPPPRIYETRMESTSGSIKGSFYQGSIGSFKTVSSAIRTTILPVTHAYVYSSVLNTSTQSGVTAIDILEPVFAVPLLHHQPDQTFQEPQERKKPKRPRLPFFPIIDDDPYIFTPPINHGNLPSQLETSSGKGKLRLLQSKHGSTAGAISVNYPSSWEGTITAFAISGDIKVAGDGLRTIREDNAYGRKEFTAKKGVDYVGEGSTAKITSISGSIAFTVGKD